MKKLVLSAVCGGLLAAFAVAGPARGQATPPPPPPPNGGTPLPGIPAPCPPTGCATATPTITPTPTATSTPTATPTNTRIPLFLQIKLAHRSVAVGKKQKVSGTTLPSAAIHVVVTFPNKTKKTHNGTANASGTFSWSFKQPAGRTSGTNHTVKVAVTADNGVDSPIKKSKKYKIS